MLYIAECILDTAHQLFPFIPDSCSYDEVQEGFQGRNCKSCGTPYILAPGKGGAPQDGSAALWFNAIAQVTLKI